MTTSATTPENAAGPHLVPLPDIAEQLGVIVTRVHQLIRDRTVIAVRSDGVVKMPAEFITAPGAGSDRPGEVVKGLTGTITLLTDAGYTDEEIIDWLFRPDETLPGTPMQALRDNRGTEVKRRAQASGF